MRSVMGGLTIGISNLETFLVTKTYPGLVHSIQSTGVFYLYSASCMGAALWVWLMVRDGHHGQLLCPGIGHCHCTTDSDGQ